MYVFRRCLQIVTFALIGAFAAIAHAGDGGPGQISYVHFMPNGVVIFYVSGGHNDVPACGQGFVGRWAFDGTTVAGRLQVAGLLSAYMGGKTIKVYGTGACTAWGDTETVSLFHTSP